MHVNLDITGFFRHERKEADLLRSLNQAEVSHNFVYKQNILKHIKLK